MSRFALAPLVAVAMLGLSSPVFAASCEPSQDPSQPIDVQTTIKFYNDTPFALQPLWSDCDGFLTSRID